MQMQMFRHKHLRGRWHVAERRICPCVCFGMVLELFWDGLRAVRRILAMRSFFREGLELLSCIS